MMSSSFGAGAGELDYDLHHLAHDTALTKKIMAKRRAEMERRAKLLNPKTRQHGCDHTVLAGQLAEKRSGQDQDREEDVYHARAAIMQEQVAQAFETMHAQGVRERQTAAVHYSLANLRQDQRREYHLSDPMELKNERNLTHDELNSMGAASCLSLGEDVEEMARIRHQQHMETRAWLNQQKEEKMDRDNMEREIDRQFDSEMQFANHVRHMCEEKAKQDAHEELLENTRDNLAIADQHRQRKFAQHEKNRMANERHMTNILNSDQLKETHPYIMASNGRMVRTEYRRPSDQEAQDVHNTNAYQIIHKRNVAKAEKQEDLEQAATNKQDIEVREAIEWKKKQATLDRRRAVNEYNNTLINTRTVELTREGARD